MLAAQTKERESHTDSAIHEPRVILPPSNPEPEAPKGSAARKWIVLLVIVGLVGAAVWKIRRNGQQ